MQISLVIPCLNEERTIRQVVQQADTAIRRAGLKQVDIIVADNGSSDRSVSRVQKQGLARIISVPVTGYGAALHWGILQARGTYVLYADADLSYRFGQLSEFLAFLNQQGPHDLVLGSRFLGEIKKGAMPFHHRYFGTPLLTFLIRVLYRLPTTDCNSGMRLVRKNFYRSLRMKNAGMEWASELLIKTALVGGKYGEVPITLHPDRRGRRPHLTSWSDGWRHLKAIILLEHSLLFVLTAILFLLSLGGLVANSEVGIFFFLFGLAFLFCTLAAELIRHALDQKPNLIGTTLLQLPLVSLAIVLLPVGIVQYFTLPEGFQVLKINLLHGILMYCLWVFFIETIKTHLVNRLPDSIRSYKSRKK